MMKTKISNSLKEVWDIKEQIYQEVKHLPLDKAIRQILHDSINITKELGFKKIQPIHKK